MMQTLNALKHKFIAQHVKVIPGWRLAYPIIP